MGNSFVIPSGTWSVIDECSGIRYLIASMFGGMIFAYINFRSPLRRAGFVAFSAIVPIVANWFRAYLIVLLGHLSDNRIAVGVDHLIYGWLFFGVVIFGMFLVGSRWIDSPVDTNVQAPPRQASNRITARTSWLVAALALATAGIGPAWAWRTSTEGLPEPDYVAVSLPQSLGDWVPGSSFAVDFEPGFENPALDLSRFYELDAQPVGVRVAYYPRQAHGSELLTFGSITLSDYVGKWHTVDRRVRSIDAAYPHAVVERKIVSDSGQLLAWEWYWVNEEVTASVAKGKLLQARARLTGMHDEAAGVVVYTPLRDDLLEARQRLARFVTDFGPSIDKALVDARKP